MTDSIAIDLEREMRAFREADDDRHFYGSWHGGSKAEGGGPGKASSGGAGSPITRFGTFDKNVIPPPAAQALAAQMAKVADNKDHEVGAAFDNAGKAIVDKSGESHSVQFTREERDALKDGHVVHNHPSGNSLSPTDVAFAAQWNAASVTAVGTTVDGERYRYTLYRPEGGWPGYGKGLDYQTPGQYVNSINSFEMSKLTGAYDNIMMKDGWPTITPWKGAVKYDEWKAASDRATGVVLHDHIQRIAVRIGAKYERVPWTN